MAMTLRMNVERAMALLTVLAITGAAGAGDDPGGPSTERDRSGLHEVEFAPLPLGTVRPSGWLRDQLRRQADGLTGHLDEFWPDIKDSAWIGGKAEGWERTPYWLDGAVPLAYLLDDGRLKAKVGRYVDYILDHQAPDGWLGPVGDNDPKHKPYDVWPLFVLLKALTQYQEATGDPRVIPALLRASKKIDEVVSKTPLYSWGRFRAADLAVSLYWLYDRTREPWLLDLARKAFQQSHDWKAQFDDLPYKARVPAGRTTLATHGVNTGMALKYGAERWRLTGAAGDRESIAAMLAQLDRYHGQANGLFTCDEHLAGRSPSQGSELCTVVEAMYSLEQAISILGDAALADRLERLAYGALAATITPDFTAHQYDQQANQVVCKVSPEHVYATNGPDANLFGLEPNFGCCTANLHQGWPKLTSHLWMSSRDGGLAAIAYAPCVVETKIQGSLVRVEVKTAYPFRDTIAISVTVPKPVEFPLHLRVPAWTAEPTLSDEDLSINVRDSLGRFVAVKATWSGTKTFTLRFPMPVRLWHGDRDAVAIERGPLVFALRVGATWKKLKDRDGIPFDDWEVHPATPWNYALELDREHPERAIRFEERPVGASPFAPAGAPLLAHVKGRRLAGWDLERNAAAPPPQSPATSDAPLEDLTLIPYGCTDLRVTEFPTLKP
jgi:hypothetical protein